tara:strand:- start:714 stop:884 length:171 start_codon:yes stop_codon:yes gene_type:complete
MERSKPFNAYKYITEEVKINDTTRRNGRFVIRPIIERKIDLIFERSRLIEIFFMST